MATLRELLANFPEEMICIEDGIRGFNTTKTELAAGDNAYLLDKQAHRFNDVSNLFIIGDPNEKK